MPRSLEEERGILYPSGGTPAGRGAYYAVSSTTQLRVFDSESTFSPIFIR